MNLLMQPQWMIRNTPRPVGRQGLTMIEVVVTVVCLAIAAAIVLPGMSDNSGERLRGAAQILAADLELAQSQSMSRADDPRLLVIDADSGGYFISARSTPTTPVSDPIAKLPHATRFGSGRAIGTASVRVDSYSLGGDNRLSFGALGQLDQATPATIQLACGARKIVITLDPTTGEITTGPLQ